MLQSRYIYFFSTIILCSLLGWYFYDGKPSNPVLVKIIEKIDREIMDNNQDGYPIFLNVTDLVAAELYGERIESIRIIFSDAIIEQSESSSGGCTVAQIVFDADRKGFLRFPNPVDTSIDLRVTECLNSGLRIAATASRISM
ncbi:MAG: hypothetical protein ABJ327_25960 [Litoreibacter sp.]